MISVAFVLIIGSNKVCGVSGYWGTWEKKIYSSLAGGAAQKNRAVPCQGVVGFFGYRVSGIGFRVLGLGFWV